MNCFDCGNCKNQQAMYYCTAKNDFVVAEETLVIEKTKPGSNWKKGNSQYEDRRRRIRQVEVRQTS